MATSLTNDPDNARLRHPECRSKGSTARGRALFGRERVVATASK